ncbi:MAG: DUF882 domain-containing protein [Gammaproteobacteria bacterium]|nr:DUF882 domain-containing protein [Gammaproteobacteria bacterium]
MNRRQFLSRSGLLSLSMACPSVIAAPTNLILPNENERILKLHNLHTGERTQATYWYKGEYLVEGLAEIYFLMRDHRANKVAAMDLSLLDELHGIQQKLETQKEIILLSGYRSQETNDALRRTHEGVAKNSFHMQGRALDFRIPGISTRYVHKATLAQSDGGVGYYRRSGFIHLDTGRKRHWFG